MSAIIQFEHASYTYPNASQPALHDVSLTIAEGDFVLVVGRSGSGKSTFLRCINGLVPHFYGGRFGGQVLVAGRDTRDNDPRQLAGIVGFVFQDPEAQMVVEIVEDELVFGLENLGIPPDVMRRRVEEVLDQLEISHLRRRRVATLSGGERQRVAIAAVLAMQPQVLILDEPTSQLDPHAAEEVLTALQKLNTDLGLTIVLSEHRLERVVQYADQLILFEQEEQHPPILTIGTPHDVLRTSPLAPPLVQLANTLGWTPLPLTVKEARKHIVAHGLDQAVATEARHPTQPAGIRSWLAQHTRKPRASISVPALAVENLTVSRDGHDILHRVSHEFAAGQVVAIMGRNGSGKTTLLRTIIGLTIPQYGRVLQNGSDLASIPVEQRAQRIGYVPQDPRSLLFHETVEQELRWTLQHSNIPHDRISIENRIQQTLALLRIEHLAQSHPHDLSGGEQQRVALATILVTDPSILLLDEPTRGLDYQHKATLISLLDDLKREGRAIVLVTHDVELVAACTDQIVLMGNGEVVVAGSPRELLNNSLIFSSQIGKLFRHRPWLTVDEAITGLQSSEYQQPQK